MQYKLCSLYCTNVSYKLHGWSSQENKLVLWLSMPFHWRLNHYLLEPSNCLLGISFLSSSCRTNAFVECLQYLRIYSQKPYQTWATRSVPEEFHPMWNKQICAGWGQQQITYFPETESPFLRKVLKHICKFQEGLRAIGCSLRNCT